MWLLMIFLFDILLEKIFYSCVEKLSWFNIIEDTMEFLKFLEKLFSNKSLYYECFIIMLTF